MSACLCIRHTIALEIIDLFRDHVGMQAGTSFKSIGRRAKFKNRRAKWHAPELYAFDCDVYLNPS